MDAEPRPSPTSWWERARAFMDEAILCGGTPPGEEARIAEIAARQTYRLVKPLVLLAGTFGLLWWPFDLLLYTPEVVRVFALWRSAVLVYCVGFYLTCDRWSVARRNPAAYATVLGATITGIVAASLGTLGPLLKPWFASLLLTPVMSFPFLVTPRVRLAGTSAVAVAGLVGFFTFSQTDRGPGDVGTAIGLMAFSVAVSTCAGHAIYHTFRVALLQSEQLERRTQELEELSAHLTQTVDARTAELRALAAYVERLRELERGAIARDLHDELGQLLTGMRMELDLAERARARRGHPGPAPEPRAPARRHPGFHPEHPRPPAPADPRRLRPPARAGMARDRCGRPLRPRRALPGRARGVGRAR